MPVEKLRAAIARAWLVGDWIDSPSLRDGADGRHRLGGIVLRPHQEEAVRRLADALDAFGGALLADEVGLGKTYTALAVARSATRPLVVAPAALRDMWRAALEVAGVRAPIVTFERLSRLGDASVSLDGPPFDLVVVDEAHHARNPATRRYRALARLAEHARVLLLSATPIHNRRADLDALLALFLGRRSRTLDDRDLARVVVRRGRSALADGGDAGEMPSVAPLHWLRPPADDAVLEALLSLPPPLPPRDGGDGGALVVHGLVRQWASSDAALRGAVARRRAASAALADALSCGRHPTKADLRAWVAGPDAVQLAFAELLVPDVGDIAHVDELLAAVRRHESALREVDARLKASHAGADDARAELLAGVVARHPGEKVVAFASYAETVVALFGRLRRTSRVVALTGAGAVVAGGRISRREALARFAPVACAVAPPHEASRVDLLLATDLLSEGVNLQDASVVVHLDLPWTSARLEQRVGRAARLGARHREVAVYAMAPPATAERVLEVEARLREKARVAGVTVGRAVGSPFLVESSVADAAPGDVERVRRTMREWLRAAPRAEPAGAATLVAGVRAPRDGFLALCAANDDADPRGAARWVLLASLGGAPPSDQPRAVRRAVETAAGSDVIPEHDLTEAALAAIDAWAAARAAALDAGVASAVGDAGVRRRLLERIAAVGRRAPHHRRAAVAARCRDARRAALLPLGAFAEWRLSALTRSPAPDDEWLAAVAAFADEYLRPATRRGEAGPPSLAIAPRAILHFVADL